MRIFKIIIGAFITLVYFVPFVTNVIVAVSAFSSQPENAGTLAGRAVGGLIIFWFGLQLLVSGIRNVKFNKGFSRKIS